MLMNIFHSPYFFVDIYTNADSKISLMFVYIKKQYPENFAFLILRILTLFARKACKFPKK